MVILSLILTESLTESSSLFHFKFVSLAFYIWNHNYFLKIEIVSIFLKFFKTVQCTKLIVPPRAQVIDVLLLLFYIYTESDDANIKISVNKMYENSILRKGLKPIMIDRIFLGQNLKTVIMKPEFCFYLDFVHFSG